MSVPGSHPSVVTFATVIRTLLVRIRALQSSRPGNPWPPSATAGADSYGPRQRRASGTMVRQRRANLLYRVTPTAWGIDPAGNLPEDASQSDGRELAARSTPPRRRRRRRLEIPIFRLPVPRGLPAT